MCVTFETKRIKLYFTFSTVFLDLWEISYFSYIYCTNNYNYSVTSYNMQYSISWNLNEFSDISIIIVIKIF